MSEQQIRDIIEQEIQGSDRGRAQLINDLDFLTSAIEVLAKGGPGA